MRKNKFRSQDGRQTAIVCGHGRSGTNYILDVLDCHEFTNCRSEPDAVSGSLFDLEKLNPKKLTFGTSDAARLASILNSLRLTKGERDRFDHRHKAYLNSCPGKLLFDALLGKRKIRQLLSFAAPEFGAGEWGMPRLLLNSSAASEVFLVAKLNKSYQACSSLLKSRNGTRIIHIVRDPVDVLRSWERRWLANQDLNAVLAKNRERLHQVSSLSASWRKRFGQIDKMSVFQSELLYWLYGNESLYTRFKSTPEYLVVSYATLVKEPVTVARRLFGFLGLVVDSNCTERVSNLRNSLFKPVYVPSLVPEQLVMKLVSSSPIMSVLDSGPSVGVLRSEPPAE